MKKIAYFTLIAALAAAPAFAADEAKVQAYVKKAGFTDEIKKSVREMASSNPNTEKLLGEINFKSIEAEYIRVLASSLSNADIEALSKAMDIPGLKEATRKQALSSQQVFGFISKEVERAAKAIGLDGHK